MNTTDAANTVLTLTSSQSTTPWGQSVTFTATVAPVAPGAGTLTGTVSFTDGGNPIAGCTNLTLSAGQATCGPVQASREISLLRKDSPSSNRTV